MDFYGINAKGNLYVEQVDSLPAWDSSYTGRLIQVNTSTDSFLYFGGLEKWNLVKCLLNTK